MREVEYESHLWPRIKNALRVIVAFTFSHVGVCGLVIGYMICGAFLFQAIESHEEDKQLILVRKVRAKTAQQLLQVVLKSNTLKEEEFFDNATVAIMDFMERVVKAIENGYDGEPHAVDVAEESGAVSSEMKMEVEDPVNNNKIQWSFSGAFLYSLTVITTIGYGNLSPRTPWGKVTTILYGIIGMPLFLLYLSNIGDILARGFKWFFARCCQCRWNCNGRRNAGRRTSEDIEDGMQFSENEEEEETITVPISLCLALMVGYIWGGGLLFSEFEEDWSVLDASYFCFISLSTIGFGDLVPGDSVYAEGLEDAIQLSFVFCSLYLLLGMALIAMCFNLMQEEVIAKIRLCGRRLGCSR